MGRGGAVGRGGRRGQAQGLDPTGVDVGDECDRAALVRCSRLGRGIWSESHHYGRVACVLGGCIMWSGDCQNEQIKKLPWNNMQAVGTRRIKRRTSDIVHDSYRGLAGPAGYFSIILKLFFVVTHHSIPGICLVAWVRFFLDNSLAAHRWSLNRESFYERKRFLYTSFP